MEEDQLFERLWSGAAQMEEWTQSVSDGIQTTRAMVLERCMERETSLMGRAFVAAYQRDAKTRSEN